MQTPSSDIKDIMVLAVAVTDYQERENFIAAGIPKRSCHLTTKKKRDSSERSQ
jgi:hypothetical protein